MPIAEKTRARSPRICPEKNCPHIPQRTEGEGKSRDSVLLAERWVFNGQLQAQKTPEFK